MKEKTTDCAAKVVTALKEDYGDIIKDYHIPTLANMETGEDTGFAVVIELNTKYVYTDNVLNDWKEKLSADEFTISVKRSQLSVRYNVHYDK